MFESINFVNRAAEKDAVFTITNGRIFASNDVFTMSAPFAVPIECRPKASTLHAIVKSANDAKVAASYTLTPTGKLSVKAGKLKALIECSTVPAGDFRPEGLDHPLNGEEFIKAVSKLEPFMGDNPNPGMQWANGMLLGGNHIRVTCNTVAVRYDINLDMRHHIVIPSVAIKELLRIKMIPTGIRYCSKSITFFYPDGYWFKTRTMENKFPNFENILDVDCNVIPPPEGFFAALKQLKPFCDEQFMSIGFTKDGLVTANGAEYGIELPCDYGLYNYQLLSHLEKMIDKIDFSLYPKPVIFTGENLKGCMVGLR